MLHRAFIGLGANLGDRRATIERALARLGESHETRLLAVSTLHETEPVGGPPDQPPYLNGVALIETAMGPRALLERLHEVERDLGRVRAGAPRFGPRTIDLDLLLFDHEIVREPGLEVPHPRLHERRFVLGPLCEIAPDHEVPGLGQRARELLARLETRPT